MGYRMLLVNSHGYYKFQVEIGAATNRDLYIKIALKHKFMVVNLVLCGDHLSAATI